MCGLIMTIIIMAYIKPNGLTPIENRGKEHGNKSIVEPTVRDYSNLRPNLSIGNIITTTIWQRGVFLTQYRLEK